jgi:beta-glucosidase
VENSGDREGAEIAEVYVSDPQDGPPRPLKELKGFAKIKLGPREKKLMSVKLDRRAFSYYDTNKHAWYAPPGEYGVLVGSSSADIRLKGSYILPRQ